MRIWISGPRLFGGLVRPGVSIGPEDIRPHLPGWRRHELRAGLQAAAKARGETLSISEANYVIDKALASGALDSSGEPVVAVKGDREACISQIIDAAATWGAPMTRKAAEAAFDKAIAEVEERRVTRVMFAIFLAVFVGGMSWLLTRLFWMQ